jgi:hypothetical protein
MMTGGGPSSVGPSQGGELVVYLQVEGAARDHHFDPEGARLLQDLGHRLQARRVAARPGPERVDLVQDQQRRGACGHPGQHDGRRGR